MTPQKQLFSHNPEKGEIGDCWRTEIACLLDRKVEEVPHFLKEIFHDEANFFDYTNKWMRTQGLMLVESPFNAPSVKELLKSVGGINKGVYYMLGGSARSGIGHVVICLDDEIVWDPHPSNVGITGVAADGFYWITWIVPDFLCAMHNDDTQLD